MSWSIWITDPPGGGRPIVAEAAAEILREGGMRVRLLQLDEFRMSLASDPDRSETELVHRALGYVAARITEAVVPVLVEATEDCWRGRELARSTIRRFAEVRLRCLRDVSREPQHAQPVNDACALMRAEPPRPRTTLDDMAVPRDPAFAPALVIDPLHSDVTIAACAVASLAKRLAAGAPERLERRLGWAIWITGRPGSGKTTVARRVVKALAADSMTVEVLDLAQARRAIVGREWATDEQDALVHRTLALIAKILTEAGVAVILDATAPRRAWRQVAREWIAHFAEVQLVCPSEICEERERATRWRLAGIRSGDGGTTTRPDITLNYEESSHPDLRLHTDIPNLMTTVEEVVRLVRRLEAALTGPTTDTERIIL